MKGLPMYQRILMLLLLLSITACSTATQIQPTTTEGLPTETRTPAATNTRTPTPSPTSTFTPTFTPTHTPPPAAGIEIVCLKVEVKSETPLNYGAKDLEQAISKILGGLDVDVEGPSGRCQAHITVDVNLAGLSDEYKDVETGEWVTCFTGQSAHGQLIFDPPSGEVLTFPIDKDVRPVQGTINRCPVEEDLFFVESWGEDVLRILKKLWGYPALASAIVTGFVRGYPYLSYQATEMLEAAGPTAISAVPDLIDLLSMVHSDPALGGNISQALQAITGQDFGTDPEAWRRWWEEQQ